MAFIPIPSTSLISALFQDDDGVLAVNRHYSQYTGDVDSTILELQATTYADYWSEVFAPLVELNWSLAGVVVRDMATEFGLEFNLTDGLPIDGTSADGKLPNQVSYTVTWLTGFVGRSFRGRTYAVGLPSGSVATGQKQLTSGAQGVYQDAWAGLLAAYNTAGHPLQVASLFEGGLPRTEGVTTPIVSARVNFPLATQRRRLR